MPESHLRAVDPAQESLDGDGLALAYASLERVRAEHGLDRLTVVVNDPTLGRQLLVTPRGALPRGSLEDAAGWDAEPPIDGGHLDVDLVATVCRQALRLATLEPSRAGTADVLEVALRNLGGVEAVAIDPAFEVIRVRVDSTASDDVAPQALRLAQAHVDHSVVVEILRSDGAGSAPLEAPVASPGGGPLEVVAVRTDPGSGELEVHLRRGEVRTVGRALLARGLVGAADATLAAWHAQPGAPRQTVRWARTVETSVAGRFVVAVALEDPGSHDVVHGIGSGPNPVDAAVAASADVLRRLPATQPHA
jgi:hypothetical protein